MPAIVCVTASPSMICKGRREYADAGYGGVKLRLSHIAPPAEQAERVRHAKDAAGH